MRLFPRLTFMTVLKLFGGLLVVGVIAGLAGAAWVASYVVRVTEDLPEIEDLAQYEPPEMSRVHAGDGRLIAEYARESRVFVPIETVPPAILAAFISAEDKNFYIHGGVDPMGLLRAQARNAANFVRGSGGSLQGGSTITQQVAKNFKLTAEQTIERKVKEMALARRLEETFSKDEILELYLNEIYLGRRAYGVAAAALLYFGKSLDELTLAEMAYLAALPKGPNNYHPVRNKAEAIGRRNWVLGRMVANGYISDRVASEAQRDDLVVAERLTGSTYAAADYFVEEVRRDSFSRYGDDELYDGGLSIRTTLDTSLQVAARNALRNGLEAYDRRHGYRGAVTRIDVNQGWEQRLAEVEMPSGAGELWKLAVVLDAKADMAVIGFLDGSVGRIPFVALQEDEDIENTPMLWARSVAEDGTLGDIPASPANVFGLGDVVMVEPLAGESESAYALRQIPQANGAIMAMDPHTGRVLALVGGYSYRLSQFNRAVQARRQPGSAFKPFVYAAALDSGYTPASTVLDAAYASPTQEAGWYKPQNYGGEFGAERFYGETTLRVGVELSRNTMTVRLANEMGLERMTAFGERFGIYDDLPPYEANSLGAAETTLWRLVTAYGMLVNGGKRIEPTILDRVQERSGRTIYRHNERGCPGCVLTAEDYNAALESNWLEVKEPIIPDHREQVIDPIAAYQSVSILKGVVERGTARSTIGAKVNKPLGGKTGTTNEYRDAWFVGFSPDLVTGVYVGFDTPRPLGNNESGGKVASPIFAEFMAHALADTPAIPFRIPPGVRIVLVDGKTGDLARPGDPGAIREAFRAGTEPTRYASRSNVGAGNGVDQTYWSGRVSIGGQYEPAQPTPNQDIGARASVGANVAVNDPRTRYGGGATTGQGGALNAAPPSSVFAETPNNSVGSRYGQSAGATPSYGGVQTGGASAGYPDARSGAASSQTTSYSPTPSYQDRYGSAAPAPATPPAYQQDPYAQSSGGVAASQDPYAQTGATPAYQQQPAAVQAPGAQGYQANQYATATPSGGSTGYQDPYGAPATANGAGYQQDPYASSSGAVTSTPSDPNAPFDLPEGWQWATEYSMAVSSTGEMLSAQDAAQRFAPYPVDLGSSGQEFEYGLR